MLLIDGREISHHLQFRLTRTVLRQFYCVRVNIYSVTLISFYSVKMYIYYIQYFHLITYVSQKFQNKLILQLLKDYSFLQYMLMRNWNKMYETNFI